MPSVPGKLGSVSVSGTADDTETDPLLSQVVVIKGDVGGATAFPMAGLKEEASWVSSCVCWLTDDWHVDVPDSYRFCGGEFGCGGS